MKYKIGTIDISDGREKTYSTYFYHKSLTAAYIVVSDGTQCPVALKDVVGISQQYNHGTKFPQYITKNQVNNETRIWSTCI